MRRQPNASTACGSGRRVPGGGIIPARSFRTAFSQTSSCPASCDRSSTSNMTPAVFKALGIPGVGMAKVSWEFVK